MINFNGSILNFKIFLVTSAATESTTFFKAMELNKISLFSFSTWHNYNLFCFDKLKDDIAGNKISQQKQMTTTVMLAFYVKINKNKKVSTSKW